MNSKQRRNTKRKYSYEITMSAPTGIRYIEHDMKVIYAKNWCNENIKDYKTAIYFDGAIFAFTNSKDAMLFSLRWL
jgi:hypothetical protein